jgi:hypothetical protein
MKKINFAVAGILSLLAAAPATAQQYPTVPARSVLGRVGAAPGDTGPPSQAIPFARLLALIGGNPLALNNLATGTQDTVIGYFGSTAASALAINNCANALIYSASTHTFGCNSTAGTGTVTTAGTGLWLTGGGSTLNLALTNASTQVSNGNPTGTTSATSVMGGIGGPARSRLSIADGLR